MSEADRKAAARQFLQQAIQAQEEEEHEKAIGFLLKADEIYSHPGHGYYLGISYAAVGQVHYAKEAYQRFAIAEPESNQMRTLQDKARREIKKLEPRIPKLTIQVDENALTKLKVLLDGKVVPNAALNAPIPVNPGQHTVSIDSESYKLPSGALELAVEEGAGELVELELQAVIKRVGGEGNAPPTIVPPTSDTAPQPDRPKSRGLVIGGTAAGGVGLVGAVVGSVLLAQAGKKKSEWNDVYDGCETSDGDTRCSLERSNELESLDDAEANARTGATVSFVVGGAALATGVTMLMIRGAKRGNRETVQREVRPIIGFQSLGVQGRF